MAGPEPGAQAAPGSTPPPPATDVVVVLDGPLAAGDVPALVERLRPVLAGEPGSTVTCNVERVEAPDMGTVDALARLALAIRRRGCRMLLAQPSADLLELLGLAGLTRVLPCGDLPVEVVRQPEQREEALRVEEERDPRDATV